VDPSERNRRAFDEAHAAAAAELPVAARELAGKRVLHLLSAYGDVTAALAGLGALVTGVEPSSVALETARAREPSLRWVQLEGGLLPPELRRGRFDAVYSSPGALERLADLPAWAVETAHALRPGGLLLVHDWHPAARCLDATMRWRESYFDPSSWRLGELVGAIAAAGFLVCTLDELPAADRRRHDPRVPAQFVLTAEKVGSAP
jgi:SAM-dependent methyltransferase